MEVLQHSNIVDKFEIDRQRRMTMQHCKREYCNAGTRQWSQRGIYIRKASKAKNSEQIIIRSNDSRYRGYPKLDIENPIIRINTAFKGCSSLEKISVLPRIYHN